MKLFQKQGRTAFSVALLWALPFVTRAATVTYNFDNLVVTNGTQMTGQFEWVYTPGDFSNGVGHMLNVDIPGYGTDLSGLVVSIDTGSIEFSLAGNFHDKDLGINLKFVTPLSPTQASAVDLSVDAFGNYVSKFVVTGFFATGYSGGFSSGSIVPLVQAVPVPAAAWLFGSGLLGLAGLARRRA